MTDLRVHGAALASASASVLRAASGVRLEPQFSGPALDILGSEAVERALRLGSEQQAQRAEIAADTLTNIGAAPAAALDAFADVDTMLAQAF